VGYCIFEPASGDIPQIAIDKEYRRKGIAALLLREMIKLNKSDTVRIVNTDILYDSITDFLKAKNITVTGKQFEMIKKI
jgi:ribosomal protein S18 acetylase RimI-like enzyme